MKDRRNRLKYLKNRLSSGKYRTLSKRLNALIERKGSQLRAYILGELAKGEKIPEVVERLGIKYCTFNYYQTFVASEEFKEEMKAARKYAAIYEREKKLRELNRQPI